MIKKLKFSSKISHLFVLCLMIGTFAFLLFPKIADAAPAIRCENSTHGVLVSNNSSGGDGKELVVSCLSDDSNQTSSAAVSLTGVDLAVVCSDRADNYTVSTVDLDDGKKAVKVACNSGKISSYFNGTTTINLSDYVGFRCEDESIVIPVDVTSEEELSIFCASNGSTSILPGGGTCDYSEASFLGFPKWYKYLERSSYRDVPTGTIQCQPNLNGIADIWKIVAAVIEIFLRIGALIAIGFTVYGGIQYVVSQGQPDKTKQALMTIINALIGLTITVVSTAFVTFIAGRF